MKTRRRGRSRYASHIEDQVADLSHEYIGRAPIEIGSVIRICVDQTEAGKASGGFEGRYIVWITNYLGIIVVYY